MPDRFWRGGSGTWNTTSTTNWSASSGGPSGASVPTVADSVFFDQAGTYTITMTGALACLDITVSAGTVTFATGTSPTLNVRGSMSLLAGTVWSSTGTITFSSTTTGRTVTTNGVTISGGIDFNGVGGGWTLGSALSTSALTNIGIAVTAGTFDTGNYNVTARFLSSSVTSTRTINLGSSTITLNNDTATNINFFVSTGLTFNAGTSSFVITTPGTVNGGGQTFYNISFTSTSSANVRAITGANTFNNLAITGPASSGVVNVTFAADQTINGTLSTTGTAGNRRVFFASATYGISQDLVVNSAPSLTDADFRGLYVRGTAAPISGTRIGNRGECRGITFSTPKTVYWNLAGGGVWGSNAWALSSGGSVSTDNFPLPQDTATIVNTGLNTGASITLDLFVPSIDMSGRTNAMTLAVSAVTVYGNWTNGSGTTLANAATLTFSGGTTQTITSAGKTFSGPITTDTYGGTVQLADALNIGSNALTVTNGTFTTAGYAVTSAVFSSTNSNIRTINLGASTCSFSSINWSNNTNLTFNAGTSQINITSTSGAFNITNGIFTFYNVAYPNGTLSVGTFTGASLTFNNLTFPAPSVAGISSVAFGAGTYIVNGTLTCAGASAVRRVFLQSGGGIGFQITLTVNAISADDCDFRDINLAGTASGASPTRAGDCGGNTGITFPAPKTVYWNLTGSQQWSATGWAPGSGGTPDINNFPLAQDTAVFDNTGSVTGTITINAAWNIGTFDASLRTSAMTLNAASNSPSIYGNWTFGTGVTQSSNPGAITFSKNGTQTITSNGVQFGCPVTINHPNANVQLADALSLGATRTLSLSAGTFDAVTYNVTTGLFLCSGGTASFLKMGAGTWTISGTGACWSITSIGSLFAGTSTIVLSDTSTAARIFNGNGLYYNKLTIGGATGTSTLTITGNNTFGELASTKTVAHTVLFQGANVQTVGKWSITGSVGNVVTIGSNTANPWQIAIAGPANTGIDYLSVTLCVVQTTSPGEFYVGANSTNVSGNTGAIIFTATPTPRTLYWVGGTGNWSSTTKWDTTSGGGGGAAIPRSLDAVIFNSLSNATAYTATIDAGVTLARCASFTMAGPASGNVTFAGTRGIAFHGDVSFSATGITRTYAGTMFWAGDSSYTFTTNGLTLASNCTVIGIGSTWTLGSAFNIGSSSLTVTYGTFSTSAGNYVLTASTLQSNNSNIRSLSLNGSTVTLSAISLSSFLATTITNLTFNAGTSQINLSGSDAGIVCGGLTFNNVSFTSGAIGGRSITGVNTFNTLSFAGNVQTGVIAASISANQTISTLTLNAGTAAAYRTFLRSDIIGTPRTLTVGTLTAGAADIDFRDITIAGAAAPISGTRFGDCKGNSGITFDAAKTVYYRSASTSNWGFAGSGVWSATSGGAFDATQFPLAQDTAVFPISPTPYPSSGNTVQVNAAYNIGTIDMSLRTSNTMTLATGTTTPSIYGNWINGTGTTLTGTGTMTFAGRGSQTITSAGKTFTQLFVISTPGGSVTLQDAFTASGGNTSLLTFSGGTFDANGYNVTLLSGGVSIAGTGTGSRSVAFGSGTWSLGAVTLPFSVNPTANTPTITGTGTISLTNASAKSFSGGGLSYSGITLNQGGAGALTITGNNTFASITNTYSATGAATINLGATTQTLTNPWTATGEAGRVLTVNGTSAASPATLRFTGGGQAANVDYLAINNVRAYDLVDKWYAGPNSTNGGSLGWYFIAAGGTVYAVTITETGTGTDSITASVTLLGSVSETGTATDSIIGGLRYASSIAESGSITDAVSSSFLFFGAVSETATGADLASAILAALGNISETATGTDTVNTNMTANSAVSETATGTEVFLAQAALSSVISESANASDLIAAIKGFLVRIFESASVSDVALGRPIYIGQIAESVTGQDVLNAQAEFVSSLSESATITEVLAGIRVFTALIAESATGTELVSALAVFNKMIAEGASVSDALQSAGSTYNTLISESATQADRAVAQAEFPTTVAETATGTETVSTAFTPFAAVAESATITDAASALAVFAARTAESANITDEVSPPGSIYNPVVLAVAQLLDQVSPAGSVYNAPVLESAVIADSLIGGFLWNLIDDSQTPDWGDISNIQVVSWVEVADNQTPNWQNVGNTQGTGWTEVNTDDDPDWQLISAP